MLKRLNILGRHYQRDEWTNVSASILSLLDRRLHLKQHHPIQILRNQIETQFKDYTKFNAYSPVVTLHQNFDSLGFPKDHIGRSKSDTYYINKDYVLRTHSSAHQAETFKCSPTPGFLISADVYRRDEIDSSHYPAFHQMEGAKSFPKDDPGLIQREIDAMPALKVQVEDCPLSMSNPIQPGHDHALLVAEHLKRTIEGIAAKVFGEALAAQGKKNWDQPLKVRWIEAYFPFTSPSWELEVWWNDEWLELCGCGVVQQSILDGAGQPDRIAWAFGLGLERIAMILFGIPDIRLFWSLDSRFLNQFTGSVVAFKSYSKYPLNKKDISFWCPPNFQENDFMELVRTIGGDLIESVKLVDRYISTRESRCYRISYRSMDRSLTNEECNALQVRISEELKLLGAMIR